MHFNEIPNNQVEFFSSPNIPFLAQPVMWDDFHKFLSLLRKYSRAAHTGYLASQFSVKAFHVTVSPQAFETRQMAESRLTGG